MLQGFVVCKSVKKRRGIVFTFDLKLPLFFFCKEAFKQATACRFIINFTIPRVVIALDLADRKFANLIYFFLIPCSMNNTNIVTFKSNGQAVKKPNDIWFFSFFGFLKRGVVR